MSSPLVICDADSIIAQINSQDLKHQEAVQITHKLSSLKAKLIYPSSVILESITFIQRVLNSKKSAYQLATEFSKSPALIFPVDHQLYSQAVINYFSPTATKKNTIFDCLVAQTAKVLDANAIFSFDKFYQKQGFTLASEI